MITTQSIQQIRTTKIDGFHYSKYQVFLTALFLGINFTYFTMAPRILNIFGFPQPGGILVFPFTFMLADVITEVYTFKYARFLVWCVIAMLGFFTLGTWLSMRVPTMLDYGYQSVFSHYPRLYFAISIATFLSFTVNNTIVSKLKTRWDGKSFWLRSLIATATAHIIFSITWVITYHIGEVDIEKLLKMILCMYIWKMTFEIIGTPIAAYISSYLKEKEGFDAYDLTTNYNPFIL